MHMYIYIIVCVYIYIYIYLSYVYIGIRAYMNNMHTTHACHGQALCSAQARKPPGWDDALEAADGPKYRRDFLARQGLGVPGLV